jgi:replicative DNA helicase
VLARDLDVPILAMSQLSRAVEQRHDKRPILSDLRESGCLAGEARVFLPDYGIYRPIRELVGRSGFRVLALNQETWRLEARVVSNAFSTGRKPVYRLRTRLGHTVGLGEATMTEAELALLGHLIGDGCTLPRHTIQYTTKDRDLAELVASLAVDVFGDAVRPRINPERTWFQVYLPSARRLTHGVRNPVAQWLDELGVFGLRSWEKRVPEKVFAHPPELIATFLRHLWSTDGRLRADRKWGIATIRYDSSSEQLTRDVQSLLLRLSINARTKRVDMGNKGRPMHRLDVWGGEDAERFLAVVSAIGERKRGQWSELVELLDQRERSPKRDTIPAEAWPNLVLPAMEASGVTIRELGRRIGRQYAGAAVHTHGLTRQHASRIADAIDCDELGLLAFSDVYWDEIVSIKPDGVGDVYDLTVEGLHNFVADDIVAHNSIEQDSDLVMFVYRDEYYNEDTDQQGLAEVILAKHRNGPTGTERLSFLKRYAKFADLAA